MTTSGIQKAAFETVQDHAIILPEHEGSVYDVDLCSGSGRMGKVKFFDTRADGEPMYVPVCPVCHYQPQSYGATAFIYRERC